MNQSNANWATRYTDLIIKLRWLVIPLTIVICVGIATGAQRLELQQDYRIFFGPDYPQLVAFDELEAVYTKNDNHVYIIHNPDGTIYEQEVVDAIHEVTEAGWELMYSTRVDSITNYQHTWSMDDDLIVEDLIPYSESIDQEILDRAREVVKDEPLLRGILVSPDEDTTAVMVRIHVPADDVMASGVVAAESRARIAKWREKYPDLRFELTGTQMLSTAFGEAPERDAQAVFPAMFAILGLFTILFTRSISGTIATWGVIILSTITAMGACGYYGYGINPVSMAAPIVVMTLAIADSVHILMTLFNEMRAGHSKLDALRESMRKNMEPVFLTSLTTSIGFLVMNFSDSPPFQQLGNTTATGVLAAWLLSITFLPAMIAILPMRVPQRAAIGEKIMDALAEFNIRHKRKLVIVVGGAVVILISCITLMKVDDVPHEYMAESIEFRRATDFFDEEIGFYGFFTSARAIEGSGAISDPEYLADLDAFGEWARQQPNVTYVITYADTAKRLNKNMHGDDPAYYRVPESRELAAQYLLLYEMSLPFGLDLNDQLNVDRSATKVSVGMKGVSMMDVQRFGLIAESWLNENTNTVSPSPTTGPPIMFSHLMEANIYSMLRGTLLGFVIIAVILVFSLRSVSLGLVSLVPNLIPAATAMGIWALAVGSVGFAVSVVAGLSIGIIVDDTVHFLSKYARARRELHSNSEDAVRYAFHSVGQALFNTSMIVSSGFAILMLSSFRLTIFMGALTSLTVICALVADFFLLPALLMLLDRRKLEDEPMETA